MRPLREGRKQDGSGVHRGMAADATADAEDGTRTRKTTGLIVDIGSWVIGEACRAAVRINAAEGGERPVYVSLNVSTRQIQHPGLVARFREALAEAGCPAALIKVEITESAAVKDYAGTSETLRELAAMGIGCIRDDFGTGCSSLGHLHRLPFETVKIDHGFVADIDGPGGRIVKAVVDIATAFGMNVVAEGVETEADLARVEALGCACAQGYLFSRPMPEERRWRRPA